MVLRGIDANSSNVIAINSSYYLYIDWPQFYF